MLASVFVVIWGVCVPASIGEQQMLQAAWHSFTSDNRMKLVTYYASETDIFQILPGSLKGWLQLLQGLLKRAVTRTGHRLPFWSVLVHYVLHVVCSNCIFTRLRPNMQLLKLVECKFTVRCQGAASATLALCRILCRYWYTVMQVYTYLPHLSKFPQVILDSCHTLIGEFYYLCPARNRKL